MPAPAKKKPLHVDTEVRVVAWLHFALALLGIGLLCLIGFGLAAFGMWGNAGGRGSGLVTFIVAVLAGLGLLALVEIYGASLLLDGDPAGKPITMVFSVLHLLNFPVGSAISVFSFWVLLRDPPTPVRPVAAPGARPPVGSAARPPAPASARPLLSPAARSPVAAASLTPASSPVRPPLPATSRPSAPPAPPATRRPS